MTFADFIITNAPALLVAIPLLAAFLCPFIGKISSTARNIWVMGSMLVTAAVAFILAYQVFTNRSLCIWCRCSKSHRPLTRWNPDQDHLHRGCNECVHGHHLCNCRGIGPFIFTVI
jgi:hypothetical protein